MFQNAIKHDPMKLSTLYILLGKGNRNISFYKDLIFFHHQSLYSSYPKYNFNIRLPYKFSISPNKSKLIDFNIKLLMKNKNYENINFKIGPTNEMYNSNLEFDVSKTMDSNINRNITYRFNNNTHKIISLQNNDMNVLQIYNYDFKPFHVKLCQNEIEFNPDAIGYL